MDSLRGLYGLNDTKRPLCNCWCAVCLLTCKWTSAWFPLTSEQARNQWSRWWSSLLSAGACTAASNHWGCLFQWKIALEITHRSCLIFRQCCILRGVISLFYFFRASRMQSAGWVVVDTEHQELYRNTVRWVVDRLQFSNQRSDLPWNEVMGWVISKSISALDWALFNTFGSSLREEQVPFHCKLH